MSNNYELSQRVDDLQRTLYAVTSYLTTQQPNPEFQKLAAQVEHGAHDHNSLDLPPIGDFAVCIGSRMLANGPKDAVAPRNDKLVRTRTYPEVAVEANYVGLWPEHNTAAFYDIRTSFQPAPLQGEVDFREAASNVFWRYASSRNHHQIEVPGEDVVFAKTQSLDVTAPITVLVDRETGMSPEAYGTSTLDPENVIQGFEIRFAGNVSLILEQDQLFRITGDQVLTSGDAKQVRTPTPPGAITSKLEVPDGASITMDGKGALGINGLYRNEGNTYPDNPTLSAARAYEHVDLPWEDITSAFFEKVGNNLIAHCPLPQTYDLEAFTAFARQAVAGHLAQSRIAPHPTGVLPVAEIVESTLRTYRDDAFRLVTDKYFTK